jgi:hypothetical protein
MLSTAFCQQARSVPAGMLMLHGSTAWFRAGGALFRTYPGFGSGRKSDSAVPAESKGRRGLWRPRDACTGGYPGTLKYIPETNASKDRGGKLCC